MTASAPVRLLTLTDLASKLNLSRTAVWAARRTPDFPKPLRLAGRHPRYVESEVDEWLLAQPRAEDTATADEGAPCAPSSTGGDDGTGGAAAGA